MNFLWLIPDKNDLIWMRQRAVNTVGDEMQSLRPSEQIENKALDIAFRVIPGRALVCSRYIWKGMPSAGWGSENAKEPRVRQEDCY